MKIKFLLYFFLITLCHSVHAQWAVENPAWVYSFTNGTAGTVSSTSSTQRLISSSSSFLPATTSGIWRVLLPSTTSGPSSYTLDPIANTLNINPSPSSSVTKFSVYDIASPTSIVTASFTITLSKVNSTSSVINSPAYQWSIGNKGANTSATTNIYDNDSGVNNPLNFGKGLFNAIRFQYNGGATSSNDNYSVGIRWSGSAASTSSASTSYITLSGGNLSHDIPYKVDVYCNNSSGNQVYTRGSVFYTVPKGSFHLWITNLSTNTSVRYTYPNSLTTPPAGFNNALYGSGDLLKSVETNTSLTPNEDVSIPEGTVLNSFLFQGGTGTSTTTPSNSKITINGDLSLSYGVSTLPVSLIAFNGELASNQVNLSWSTAAELNNDFFLIQRCGDDKIFQTIGKVYGNGTSSRINNYYFRDKNLLQGNNYYRLIQVDKNGDETVLEKLVFIKSSYQNDSMDIFNDGANVKINIQATDNASAKLFIYNTVGQKVFENSINLNTGFNQFSYDFNSFKDGVYIVKLIKNQLLLSKKFIKN